MEYKKIEISEVIDEVFSNIDNLNLQELNERFRDLLNHLRNYLQMERVNSQVELIITHTNINENEYYGKNILSLGAKRVVENNLLKIEVFLNHKDYFPIIFLREALFCFIPNNLKENFGIKIILNQIVENILQKFEIIDEWRTLIREYIIDYNFLSAGFDRLEKFYRLQEETMENTIIRILRYIRENLSIIADEMEDFHDNIIKDFILKTSSNMYSDEMAETLRILQYIFYRVKSYSALLQYKDYFQQLKASKEITTELSLRKFISNIRWLHNFSQVAPSYQIDLGAIGVGMLYCKLCFHPLLDKSKLDLIIEELPFFYMSRSSESCFSIQFSGWFLYPLLYHKDIINFLNKLEDFGYLVKIICSRDYKELNYLNLNYFREFYRRGRLINHNHKGYDNIYELEFEMNFGESNIIQELNIRDYVIMCRVMFWSSDGFSFERRSETAKTIKNDIFYEILSRKNLISRMKILLEKINLNNEIKQNFLHILNNYQDSGFFFLRNILKRLVESMKIAKKILIRHKNITNIYQFQEFINNEGVSKSLQENILFLNPNIKKVLYREILPTFFQDFNKFNQTIRHYKLYRKIFNLFYQLKIFSLKSIKIIIKDEKINKKILVAKRERLKSILNNYKTKSITSQVVEDALDSLSSKRILKPYLINTLNTSNFAKYYIELILKYDEKCINYLDSLKIYFPRLVYVIGIDIATKEKIISSFIWIPTINREEKYQLISILHNLFKENLISLRRFLYDGFLGRASLPDFYDLSESKFFYTKDLFEQYFKYVQKVIRKKLTSFKQIPFKGRDLFWTSDFTMDDLVKKIEDTHSRERNDYNIHKLIELFNFFKDLNKILTDINKFKEIKDKEFFKKYIKAIKFIPAFQMYGFSQYFLYIRPIDMSSFDFKLLFFNNFQNVKFSAYIDDVQSLFIKYIYPFRKPNMAYVNWLTKSKRCVSEYCIFYIKKLYQILHFDRNISSSGWNLNANQFKSHIQNVLFRPEYKFKIPTVNPHDIGEIQPSDYFGPNSSEYNDLIYLYNCHSKDIKSILGTIKQSVIERIVSLLEKNLIYPYLKLKNLGFKEKIYIILPSVKKELIDVIIKVFNFFNYGFIYIIEGDYFIHGFSEEKKFENGIMIKLYLPPIELSNFQRVFNLLFQYLEIKKYLILSDLVDGANLLKSIFGNLDFFKDYNPLRNLIWNNKDKIWMNPKLFNENFEPQYPKLIPSDS